MGYPKERHTSFLLSVHILVVRVARDLRVVYPLMRCLHCLRDCATSHRNSTLKFGWQFSTFRRGHLQNRGKA